VELEKNQASLLFHGCFEDRKHSSIALKDLNQL